MAEGYTEDKILTTSGPEKIGWTHYFNKFP